MILILLDEPTNNLDDSGVILLEDFIDNSPASFLIVSHDRHFLRNTAERIIELTGDKGVNKYNLGYDEYIEARREARQAMIDRYEQYEKEKKRLYRVARDARVRANSAKASHKKSDSDKLMIIFAKSAHLQILQGRLEVWSLVCDNWMNLREWRMKLLLSLLSMKYRLRNIASFLCNR